MADRDMFPWACPELHIPMETGPVEPADATRMTHKDSEVPAGNTSVTSRGWTGKFTSRVDHIAFPFLSSFCPPSLSQMIKDELPTVQLLKLYFPNELYSHFTDEKKQTTD